MFRAECERSVTDVSDAAVSRDAGQQYIITDAGCGDGDS